MPIPMTREERLAQKLLGQSFEDLTEREKTVLRALVDGTAIAIDTNAEFSDQINFWDTLADKLARFVGSWPFIFGFLLFLAAWMALNGYLLIAQGDTFDPYPYILLNLVLSTVASIQAPVIMMSQNRQAVKDRISDDNRFKVHLKNELAVQQLQEKLDRILSRLPEASVPKEGSP
ncbi:MAG: DUF1003 domain-containing protein [Pseudomonadota bacterium]